MSSATSTLLTASYSMLLALEVLSLLALQDLILLLCVLRPAQCGQQYLVYHLRTRLSAGSSKRQQLTTLLMRLLAMDAVLYMLCATLLYQWRRFWPWFACALAIAFLSLAQMWREYAKEINRQEEAPNDGTPV